MRYEAIEQTGHPRLQRLILFSEELFFGSASLFPLSGVNIIRVWRYGDWIMPGIINPPLNIHVVAVIDKILQMVCIAALATPAKEYHSLADKDAPLWVLGRLVD